MNKRDEALYKWAHEIAKLVNRTTGELLPEPSVDLLGKIIGSKMIDELRRWELFNAK